MTTLDANSVFYSAKLRLARAEEHLTDLKPRITQFFSEKPYTRISDPDPNGTHEIFKLRLTKGFPFRWRILATEIIEHARSSLDHATWATAYARTRNPNLEFGVFPFTTEKIHLDAKIKGVSKDCPPEIQVLLRSIEPCQDGQNNILWVLNDICNLSKHALVTFIAKAVATGTLSGTAFRGPIQFLDPFILDPVKNEIPYMRVLKGSAADHDFDVAIYPLLEYREFTSEEPATDVLAAFIDIAGVTVNEIEAEAKRIGLVK